MDGESHHKRELNKDPLQPYPRSTGFPRAEVLLGNSRGSLAITMRRGTVARPATAASSNGYGRASRKGSCAFWPRRCMPEDNWNWRRPLSTPPSRGRERGLAVGPTKRGKGTKIFALADDHSLPLAVSIESTSKTSLAWCASVACRSYSDVYYEVLTFLPAWRPYWKSTGGHNHRGCQPVGGEEI
jgi:hypothetical protein